MARDHHYREDHYRDDRYYYRDHEMRERERDHYHKDRDDRIRDHHSHHSSRDRDSEKERERDERERRERRSSRKEGERYHSRSPHRSSRSSSSRTTEERPSRSSRESSKRKRRSRSPTPEEQPKKKRSSAWDQVPEGLDGLSPSEIRARIAITKAPVISTVGMNMFVPQPSTFSPMMNSSSLLSLGGNGILGGNVSSHTQAKRLYIGNVPPDATEAELKDFFKEQYIHAGFTSRDRDVIHSAQINYERNYGFIELDTPELATSGLSFDGISFRDHTLKVRRPRDYQGTDSSPIPGLIRGIVSTNVPDTPNKVFIGGLPATFTEDQVKELVGHFGELKAFHLVKDNQTNVSKGYAFFEYLDPNVTDRACRALNNKDFGGKTLLVQRAHLGAKNNTQTIYDLGAIQSTLTCLLNLQVAVTSTLQNNNLQLPIEPTRVLVLLNLVSFSDLCNKEEVSFLEEDVRNECSKYGTVESVVIPSAESEDGLETVKGIGRIFVCFRTIEEAMIAQKAMALRKYNHRCVLTTYFNEQQFLAGSYDGSEDPVSDQAIEKLQQHYKNELASGNNSVPDNMSYHQVPPPPM